MTVYDDIKQKLSTIYKDFSSEYIKNLIKISTTDKKYEQLLNTNNSLMNMKTVNDTEIVDQGSTRIGLMLFIKMYRCTAKKISAIDFWGG